MPRAAKKPCKYQGCRALVDSSYCDAHKSKTISKQFDKNRGSSSKRGYNYKWQKARKQFLAIHPLCAECNKSSKVTAANVVDHITPHKGNQTLFWDETNWQPLCTTCHNRKTATQDSAFANKQLPDSYIEGEFKVVGEDSKEGRGKTLVGRNL